MSLVMIRCPISGEPVSTGIEVEPVVLRKLPNIRARMFCPTCGQEHIWALSAAWLAEEPPEGWQRTGTAG